ncbi:mll6350 [Mesorhizobium japonicum MAFF 303099]|uniref:Mll6350 protein n=1 Tax=Mesorhizobium japonicum (strain LMG 29417 / CECT 9101 / MAFF 303099) TaxID=266835 RepID=Q989N2_RHILO|nr:mll6350 [Mesorhizobium japonicum MAFF 303099]
MPLLAFDLLARIALPKVGLPLERVNLEACSLTAWPHDGLRAEGQPVHVKSWQCRLWRSLLVHRHPVLNEMRSIENMVRTILREACINWARGREPPSPVVCRSWPALTPRCWK